MTLKKTSTDFANLLSYNSKANSSLAEYDIPALCVINGKTITTQNNRLNFIAIFRLNTAKLKETFHRRLCYSS